MNPVAKNKLHALLQTPVLLAATVSMMSLAGCSGSSPMAPATQSLTQNSSARVLAQLSYQDQVARTRIDADIAKARLLADQIANAPRPAIDRNNMTVVQANTATFTTQATDDGPFRVGRNEITLSQSAKDIYVQLSGGRVVMAIDGQSYAVDGIDPGQDLVITGNSNENLITVDCVDGPGVWTGLQVSGQAGDDRITVNNQSGAFAGAKIQVNGGSHNDILTVQGSAGAYMIGDSGHDIINGSEGADTIHGDSGDDTIMGNGGNDYIDGDANDDCIVGNAGDDTIYSGPGNDYAGGNEGNDRVYGGPGHGVTGNPDDRDHETLDGGSGDDYIEGGPQNDIIHGNDGNDLIYSGQGDDYVTGDAGDDVIYGGNGKGDNICGGSFQGDVCVASGNDTLENGKPNGGGNQDLPPGGNAPGADPNNTNNGTAANNNGNGSGSGRLIDQTTDTNGNGGTNANAGGANRNNA